MNKLVTFFGAVVLICGWSAAAVADEAKSQISASMLLRVADASTAATRAPGSALTSS